jgi:MFS family permease
MILMLIGAVAGIISTSCFLFIPGGHPDNRNEENSTHLDGIINTFRDKNFVLFLTILGLALIGVAIPMYFVPLFLKEKAVMPVDKIIFLEVSTNLGTFLSVFFWGWAADRYGSKPIMLTSLWCLLFIPILWTFFPRHYNFTCVILATLIVFFYGLGSVGWMTGWCRYLYTGAMPAEKKTAYTSVFYAWISITGGLAPLINGWLADMTKRVNGHYGSVIMDSYTLLFMLCFFCFLFCILLVYFLKNDSSYTMLKFLKSLIAGEPLTALSKWIRKMC